MLTHLTLLAVAVVKGGFEVAAIKGVDRNSTFFVAYVDKQLFSIWHP